MRRIAFLALVAFVSVAAVPAPPAPGTCGTWVPQTNGTAWRMCTDMHNNNYCEYRTGGRVLMMECP